MDITDCSIDGISSIFNCDGMDAAAKQQLHEDMLFECFFLPPELLTQYKENISQITVLSQEEFAKFRLELDKKEVRVYSDVGEYLLDTAHNVGVSCRHVNDYLTVICKVWYSKRGFVTIHTDRHLKQIEKLYSFCGIV